MKALLVNGSIHPAGRLITFMDRLFYSAGNNLAFKPAAAILSARRSGQVCSMDVEHLVTNFVR